MIAALYSLIAQSIDFLLDLEERRPVSSLQPSTVKLPTFGRGFPPRPQPGSITA